MTRFKPVPVRAKRAGRDDGSMRVQKLGHSCLLVTSGGVRLLIDPGTFSPGFDDVDGLSAVLVTHQHPDHIDVARLPQLLDRNPEAQLIADAATAQTLRDDHGIEATVASAGDIYDLGMRVEVVGDRHAEIHPDIPRVPNVGYVINDRLLHPGDSLDVIDRDVQVLALPTMAPWMRMADAVEFLRAVAPRVAVPIHEALLKSPDLFYGAFRGLGPDGTEVRVLDDGEPVDL
jgi:L-ascorbate metabolism protein UlaG (beta-lactamase superfamily)